jgi:hypothetical protein
MLAKYNIKSLLYTLHTAATNKSDCTRSLNHCYFGGHDCSTVTVTIYVRRIDMATDFQTYKEVNIWCNCEHVSVGVFSCKQCGRRERKVL